KAREGHRVDLAIGEADQHGKQIEVVNEKEVEICRISADYKEEFEIIVCPKGSRDLAAQKYYKIIKTSSDIALAKMKKEMEGLLTKQEKDYNLIADYSERIATLEQQTDSLVIYREAFQIASINKDNASMRVLKYLQLLDEGNSIMEAREALSIQDAVVDLEQGISLFNAAIEELKTRAGASSSIFDYEDAITCYDTIINYSEKMKVDPLMIVQYYNEKGELIFENGNYEKALVNFQKSCKIGEGILDSKHYDLAITYDNIGVLYRYLGEYEKGLEYQNKSLTLQEDILDPKHPQIAITCGNIGITYDYLGQYEKALEYLQRALVLQEEILDPKHQSLSVTYNDIGGVYLSLEEYEKGLEYQQKALKIDEEILDPNHPQLANTYDNIGVTYRYLEQFDKALELHLKAYDKRKKALNPNHPDIAYSLSNIGGTYLNLGKYEEALEYQQKTLAIRKEILDPNHPDIAWSYYDIGLIYLYMEKYELAVEFQQKDLDIQEEILEPSHPLLAIRYHNLGTTYLYWEQFDKALQYFNRALDIRKEVFGINHPALAVQYGNIGLTYIKKGLFGEAYKAYKKYEEIRPNHGNTFRNWTMYYAVQNDIENAIVSLEKAIELGFSDINWLETNYTLDSLRDSERFKVIIDSLKKDKSN
ncbi:MAG: tetratricopeptide repeat protein, partial [Saprospiraceae bacterium]|nr:tetratricopeptide repeat protein [Saprospiraceae bacterium]